MHVGKLRVPNDEGRENFYKDIQPRLLQPETNMFAQVTASTTPTYSSKSDEGQKNKAKQT